jgi:hypothetical protein
MILSSPRAEPGTHTPKKVHAPVTWAVSCASAHPPDSPVFTNQQTRQHDGMARPAWFIQVAGLTVEVQNTLWNERLSSPRPLLTYVCLPACVCLTLRLRLAVGSLSEVARPTRRLVQEQLQLALARRLAFDLPFTQANYGWHIVMCQFKKILAACIVCLSVSGTVSCDAHGLLAGCLDTE